jgi:lipopolysaccharide export LptBFGC system permease protein LptF
VTLQLYILRQLLTALAFAITGMVMIAIPGLAISAIQRLGGAFIGPMMGFLPLLFVGLVPYLIPLGFLLSVVATYGRLAAENEWTAMAAAGFSPLRLLLPGFAIAAVLGLLSCWLARDVEPRIAERKRDYSRGALVQSLQTLAPGRTKLKLGDFFLSARHREEDMFRDVIVNIPGDEGEPDQQLLAQRLNYEIDDEMVSVHLEGARMIHGTHDAEVGNITIRRSLDSLGKGKPDKIRWKHRTSRELAAALERGEVPPEEASKATYDLHYRNASLAACVMFLLIGAPTGLLLRRGTQLGALACAVGYALLYFLLTLHFGRGLANAGVIAPWICAWATPVIGGVIGSYLTWKVARA